MGFFILFEATQVSLYCTGNENLFWQRLKQVSNHTSCDACQHVTQKQKAAW